MILLSTFSHAQDYYVSNALGSDGNDGLETSPFQTINRAISEVEAGGTVYVMEGTYRNQNYGTVDVSNYINMNNPHVVTINKSGTAGAYITLKNYPGHTPIIQFDGRGGIVISNDMNYIIVEGFEVVGPAASITYAEAYANREYKVLAASDPDDDINYNHTYFSGKGIWGGYGAHHHIIIRNNIVHDTAGSGIRFNDSDHITIEYNEVYNTTWWTSSASSAVVFAETIASSEADNGTDVKMVMRGNLVYNNWNRIPFYVTQLPDNSGNTNPNYGTATYNNILDGQGLYVTRSDDNYYGTFLFENNVCVNNGKNGINFDNSLGASAIIQNNTFYYNGVHEIIQDISVANGNPGHRGQKVGGVKANKVQNVTVANNIVVTRDNLFSAIELPNISGSKLVLNNIFLNGKLPSDDSGVPYNFISCCNLIDVDPLFIEVPSSVNGAIDISQANFELTENSPAINAGDSAYSPLDDFLGNPRPTLPNAISFSSFENSTGGWSQFGSPTLTSTTATSKSGDYSLSVSNRTENWHSPKLALDNLMEVGQTYTFYVWVKLASGGAGNAQITIKNTTLNTYTSVTTSTAVNDQDWTLLTGDFTYPSSDLMFAYVKGPNVGDGVVSDFYIDDFTLVPQGSAEVDFSNIDNDDVVDIGAYEFINTTAGVWDNDTLNGQIFVYPNPARNQITISKYTANDQIEVMDLLGKYYQLSNQGNTLDKTLTLDVSSLSKGIYLVKIRNSYTNSFQTLKFLKH
ncbi:MAG: carbohydrate binding domain-containing protein [Flavobacteriaceae bacterium]|nr:carbohydrate binding domain-containing protein [Flavobacteriaceae bacterium]